MLRRLALQELVAEAPPVSSLKRGPTRPPTRREEGCGSLGAVAGRKLTPFHGADGADAQGTILDMLVARALKNSQLTCGYFGDRTLGDHLFPNAL
jgi:hypothetical protein